MDNDHKFLSFWSKQRAIGKARFILTCGVMGWGSTCALLTIVLFSCLAMRNDPFLKFIVLMSVLFPMAGLLWGWIVFSLNEGRYREMMKDQSEQSAAPLPPAPKTGPSEGAR